MAKQSLGRDLGALMGRDSKQADAPVGAGVSTLIRGNSSPGPTSPAPAPPKAVFPRWYLFAGDVLLVSLALVTLFMSRHPLSWQREVFCAALVILAAVLAVIALVMPDGKATARGNP